MCGGVNGMTEAADSQADSHEESIVSGCNKSAGGRGYVNNIRLYGRCYFFGKLWRHLKDSSQEFPKHISLSLRIYFDQGKVGFFLFRFLDGGCM